VYSSADSSRTPWWTDRDVVGNYFDPVSGRMFVVAQPAFAPELWSAYLDGARRSYRRHGVEGAVDFARVRSGASTSLFFAVVEPDGQVVGGMRVQGPYTHVEQAYAIREWAGREGTDELRRQIARRLDDGVIEIKAVWVNRDAARHGEVTAGLARAFVHSLHLMDVRYAFCTAASHAVPRWQSSGGVVNSDVTPVPYPDERYVTWLIWWDRENVFGLIAGDQVRMIMSESGELFSRPTVTPGVSPSVV